MLKNYEQLGYAGGLAPQNMRNHRIKIDRVALTSRLGMKIAARRPHLDIASGRRLYGSKSDT